MATKGDIEIFWGVVRRIILYRNAVGSISCPLLRSCGGRAPLFCCMMRHDWDPPILIRAACGNRRKP
jgi:hypothetical protein